MVGEVAGRQWAEQRIREVIASIEWPAQIAVAGEDGRAIEYAIRWRTIHLNSGLGPLRVHRPVYIATGQPTLQPADAWLGIDRSRSPMLMKMCAAMAAQLPFAEADGLLAELTPIEISACTIRDVALDLGRTAQQMQESPTLPPAMADGEPIAKAVVQLDGGHAPIKGGWQEARVARIELTTISGVRATFALTGIVTAAIFWIRLKPLLERLGAAQAKLLAFIGDGAKWVLADAKSHFPHATCILDFYHLAKRVHETAAVLWGENTPKTKAWARHYLKQFKRSRVDTVLEAWERLWDEIRDDSSRSAADRQRCLTALGTLFDYVFERREFMRYRRARNRGLPIGSGRIEAWIKHLLSMRLKRPGARWSVASAEAMLALRAAIATDQFDAVCRTHIARLTDRIPQPLRHLLTPDKLLPTPQPPGQPPKT